MIVAGFFGKKNLGDELLFKSIKYFTKEKPFKVPIDSLKVFKNEKIIITGGFFYGDNFKSCFIPARFILLNLPFKNQFFGISLGIGPEGKFSFFKKVLKYFKKIVVRDRISFKIAKKYNNNVYKDFDISFYYLSRIFRKVNLKPEEKTIGIIPKPWNINYKEIINFLNYLKKEKFKIKVFSLRPTSKEINLILNKFKEISDEFYLDWLKKDFWKNLLKCETFITLRLHGLILSYVLKRKAIGISYHPKIYETAKLFKIENYILSPKEVMSEILKDRFFKLMDDKKISFFTPYNINPINV